MQSTYRYHVPKYKGQPYQIRGALDCCKQNVTLVPLDVRARSVLKTEWKLYAYNWGTVASCLRCLHSSDCSFWYVINLSLELATERKRTLCHRCFGCQYFCLFLSQIQTWCRKRLATIPSIRADDACAIESNVLMPASWSNLAITAPTPSWCEWRKN